MANASGGEYNGERKNEESVADSGSKGANNYNETIKNPLSSKYSESCKNSAITNQKKSSWSTGATGKSTSCEMDLTSSEKNEKKPERIPIQVFPTAKKLVKGESFFALDPLRKNYPKTLNKVLPESQPDNISVPDNSRTYSNNSCNLKALYQNSYSCNNCKRTFTTKSGRTNHMKKCSPSPSERKKEDTTLTQTNDKAGCDAAPENSQTGNNSATDEAIVADRITIWGAHTAEDLKQIISAAYEEIVHWKKNLFLVPSGAAGKKFVKESARLVDVFNSDAVMAEFSIKVLMIMPLLLLQKPNFKSKSKLHAECLARRLSKWEDGDLDALLLEGRTIQKKLKENESRNASNNNLARHFTNFMLRGQTTAAMRLLDSTDSVGVLTLNDEIMEELKVKHPEASTADPSVLINVEVPFVDPVMFEDLDGTVICRAASRTKGSAGPSRMDAENWKRILLSKSFGKESKNLQESIAKMARIPCTRHRASTVPNENPLEAYTACRLIPLDKNPGIHPIGIGETLRRIIGKAILEIVKEEVMNAAGSLQLCAGQAGGCEAAVHAANKIFDEEETDAILLVDANNAFNALNREVMLHNIHYVCPLLAAYIRNCYHVPSRLFVAGGKELKSSEGTTQGDPQAMPVYAVGITPLLPVHNNPNLEKETKQIAFADDLAGAGKLKNIKSWWDQICTKGPLLGYFPKASKSWMVVKPSKYDEAKQIFGRLDDHP
ncbi:MAG: C2H2-type zinc finger protein [Bacteroidota bacterium]